MTSHQNLSFNDLKSFFIFENNTIYDKLESKLKEHEYYIYYWKKHIFATYINQIIMFIYCLEKIINSFSNDVKYLAPSIIFLLADVVNFFMIEKLKFKDLVKTKIIINVKLLLNLFFFGFINAIEIMNLKFNDEISIIINKNLLLQCFILWLIHGNYFKLVPYTIFAGVVGFSFFSIWIIINFYSLGIETDYLNSGKSILKFNNTNLIGNYIDLKISCLKNVDYNSNLSSILEILFDTSYTPKYSKEEINNFMLNQYLSLNVTVPFLNSKKEYNIKYKEALKNTVESKFESKYVANCFLYYLNYTDQNLLLTDNVLKWKIISTGRKIYVSIIIALSILFILIYNTYILGIYQREFFSFNKTSQILIKYFESFIDNMHFQSLSLIGDKILSYNKCFSESLNKSIKESNDIKIIKHDEILFNEGNNSSVINKSTNDIKKDLDNKCKIKTYFKNLIKKDHSINCCNENNPNNNLLYYLDNMLKTKLFSSETRSSFLKPNLDNNEFEFSQFSDSGIYSCTSNREQNKLIDIKNDIVDTNIKEKVSETIYLGIFVCETNKKFYKVYIKIFHYTKTNFILDILLDDITDIFMAEKSLAENKIRTKIFSKIAHEFKTPLIIIKSLISEFNSASNADRNQISDHICNLSDYISFLIQDIIYSANPDIDIVLNISEVNIMELVNFCKVVCKSLLLLQETKKNIKVISKIDQRLSKFKIKSDTTRLKQVMLNFYFKLNKIY